MTKIQKETAPVTEPKHTPGEWAMEVGGRLPITIAAKHETWKGQPYTHVCEVGHLKFGPTDFAENVANARLIAAAPETARQRDELSATAEMVRVGFIAVRKALGIERELTWLELANEAASTAQIAATRQQMLDEQRDGYRATVEENAAMKVQREELYDELSALRKHRHLEQVAASLQKAKLEQAEKQRDELLARVAELEQGARDLGAAHRSQIEQMKSLFEHQTAQRDELLSALIELEGESDYTPASPQMAAALTRARAAIARCQPAEKGDA